LIRGGDVGDFWGTCLVERMCTQNATRDGNPGTKRLIGLLCLRVLPVQPYDNMGSVLTD
jgi:hypothetical protein